MTTDRLQAQPRYAYEDPAALAWTAQMFRTARRRRLLREAAEAAAGKQFSHAHRQHDNGGDVDA
jgi:hypothetical protein